jgi:hypothetical protein
MKFEGALFCEEAEEDRVKMSPACQTGPRTRGARREGHGASEAAAKAEAWSAAISCRTGLSRALESISCVKTSCERCVRERGPLPD